MNKQIVNIRCDLLLFVGSISLVVFSHLVQANDEKIPIEILELMVAFPIQSDEVDIDVTMDKDIYKSGDMPKLSITGYNKTTEDADMDVHIGFIGSDGTVYEYPDWNTSSSPWLTSFTIPQNYQLSPTFVTTTNGIPGLALGKWYAAAGLAEPGTDNLVSFKVYPFILESVNDQPVDPVPELPQPETPTTPPRIGSTAPPSGMIGLWDLLVFGLGADGFSQTMTDDFVMIFDDGTLTDDIATVLNEGVDVSKSKNPKDWGEWRQNGDKYEYKWSSDDSFDEPHFGNFQVQPGSNDQRINECFSRISTSGNTDFGGHDLAVQVKRWCFKSEGTFDYSSTASLQGSDAIAWGSSPAESGRYRIDGNILVLFFNDGRTKNTGFGFLNDERTHILINTSRYH